MNTITRKDRELVRQQVAFLASEGLTQKKIASTLGFSQSTVSLFLKEATTPPMGERALLDPRPRLLLEDRERVRIQNSLFIGALEEELERYANFKKLDFVPKVYVGLTEGEGKHWDLQVRTWGQAIAPSVVEIMKGATSICVAWGRLLRSVIDGIGRVPIEKSESDPITIFGCWPPRLTVRPGSDETIYRDHTMLDSNALAYDLSTLLNRSESVKEMIFHYLPGLDLIPFTKYPFVLDPSFTTEQVKRFVREEQELLNGVKSALFHVDSYKSIFGSPEERTKDCLLRNCDCMLLPSGPAGGRRAFAMGENYGGVPTDWYRTSTLGDIGGYLFPAKDPDEMTVREQLQYVRYQMRWLGLREDDIQYTAKHGSIGTVVCAVGSDRTDVILHGIKNHLIRHLCCDSAVAKSITAALKREMS